MMGTQQSQQAMGNQMMRNTMMREMSTMMKQMNGMMQKMSNTMAHGNMNDQTHMQDMSQTMKDMSDIMKEMAGRMAEGKMEPADMNKLQERMKSTSQALDKMAKEHK
jgi:methyl-accepting chemotaxis protein